MAQTKALPESTDIRKLAKAIEQAATIHVYSGDREPGRTVSEVGRNWILEALELLAQKKAAEEK